MPGVTLFNHAVKCTSHTQSECEHEQTIFTLYYMSLKLPNKTQIASFQLSRKSINSSYLIGKSQSGKSPHKFVGWPVWTPWNHIVSYDVISLSHHNWHWPHYKLPFWTMLVVLQQVWLCHTNINTMIHLFHVWLVDVWAWDERVPLWSPFCLKNPVHPAGDTCNWL